MPPSIDRRLHRSAGRARRGNTVLLSVVATAMIVALAVVCVGGAMAQNRRAGASLRAHQERVLRVARQIGVDPWAIDAGRETYMGTCTACHGPSGQALPGLGKDLAHSEFVRDLSDGALLMFLKIGRSTWDPMNTTGVEMPGKGGNPMLNDDDLREIVSYLRFLQISAAGGAD
ncbi:MAG: cytochrome c [Phycisphaerales bacterium]